MSFTGSRWHGLPEPRLFNFPPGLRLAYSEERGPIGVPVTADVALFQYNNTMMQNAGVPPLSQLGEAWSWHEMIEVGREFLARAETVPRGYRLRICRGLLSGAW